MKRVLLTALMTVSINQTTATLTQRDMALLGVAGVALLTISYNIEQLRTDSILSTSEKHLKYENARKELDTLTTRLISQNEPRKNNPEIQQLTTTMQEIEKDLRFWKNCAHGTVWGCGIGGLIIYKLLEKKEKTNENKSTNPIDTNRTNATLIA